MSGATGAADRACGGAAPDRMDLTDPRVMSSCAVTRAGVVVPCRTDPLGVDGPTPGRARGPHWRRVAPGWSVPVETDSTATDQRIVEAMAGTPADAAVTGWASLAWSGAEWFTGMAGDGSTPLDVPVALDGVRGIRSRSGLAYSEDWLFADDVEVVDGLVATIAARSVWHEVCRTRSLIPAVRTIDLAAAADLVDVAAMRDYAARLGARPGIRRLRLALDWSDENVWSPQEVTMRITWRHHCGGPLLTNCPLFDLRGDHLLTPDLLDEAAGVVGEYDGAIHLEDARRRRDLDREALYRDHGLELVTMMSSSRPDATTFLARLDAAYRRAAQRRGAVRSWTTEQPPWWVDTSTVARRRLLSADQRRVWLRRLTG